MILLRRGQDAAESETWIRLENGAVLEQSRNPRFKAARQTVCEKGALLLTAASCSLLTAASCRARRRAAVCGIRGRSRCRRPAEGLLSPLTVLREETHSAGVGMSTFLHGGSCSLAIWFFMHVQGPSIVTSTLLSPSASRDGDTRWPSCGSEPWDSSSWH